MRLLPLAVAALAATTALLLPPPSSATGGGLDPASLASSAAGNATLSALATLLAGKNGAANCPLLNDTAVAAEATLISNKLASFTTMRAPALCSALGAAPGDAQCALLGFIEKSFTSCSSFPVSCAAPNCTDPVGTGVQKEPPATSVTGVPLPAPIDDLRPLPFKVADSAATLAAEGATYNYWYHVIINLSAYTGCAAAGGAWLTPAGWTTLALPTVPQEKASPGAAVLAPLPFAAVMVNPAINTMAVVMRGTATNAEWLLDFDYNMVKMPAGVDVPGLVHRGALTAYEAIAPAINAALDAQVLAPGSTITRITFTGHSLGSGVAQLAAAAAAARLANAGSPAIVDALLFAPVNVGSPLFVAAYDAVVNSRRVVFEYDVVPQIPCKAQFACSAKKVKVPTDEGVLPKYPYEWTGGTVTLRAAEMGPQAKYWAGLDRINLCHLLQQLDGEKEEGKRRGAGLRGGQTHTNIAPPPLFLSATHVCSYMCATSAFTGRTDDWCLLRSGATPEETAAHSYCTLRSVALANRGTFPSNDYPPEGKLWGA
jgi:hypothetical protein